MKRSEILIKTCYGLGLAVQMHCRIFSGFGTSKLSRKNTRYWRKKKCERSGFMLEWSKQQVFGFWFKDKEDYIALIWLQKHSLRNEIVCFMHFCFHISASKLVFQSLNMLKGIFVLLLKYNPQWSTAILSCLMEWENQEYCLLFCVSLKKINNNSQILPNLFRISQLVQRSISWLQTVSEMNLVRLRRPPRAS